MAYINYGLGSVSGTVTDFDNPSYTIRSFNPSTKIVDINNYDTEYHTYYQNGTVSYNYYFGNSVPSTGTVYVKNQENWTYSSTTQSSLASETQTDLDLLTQDQIETGDPTSNNADGKYNYGLFFGFSGTVEITSSYEDNLLQGAFNNAGTYYIQMALFDFPGTGSANTLDRSQSSITFSSSETYQPEQSVTIPFDSPALEFPLDSLTDSDELWRINRDVLVDGSISGSGSVDLANLKKIKFNLVASGGGVTLKSGPMKMVPDYHTFTYANVDTKVGILTREEWPTLSQSELPILLQDGLTVKNYNYVAKFHLESVPQAGGTHELSIYGRVNPNFIWGTAMGTVAEETNCYLKTKLLIDNSSYTIGLYEDYKNNWDNLTFSVTKPEALTTGDYFLVINYLDDQWEAQLYSADGENFSDQLKIETGLQTIQNSWLKGSTTDLSKGKGYAGYHFVPDEYGHFYLDFVFGKNAILAEYTSKTFNSYTPVIGATLFPRSVPDNTLLNAELNQWTRVGNANNFILPGKNEVGFIANPQDPSIDDVYIEEDNEIFYTTSSLKVTKKSNSKIAAIEYPYRLEIENFSKLVFKAKLKFNNVLSTGNFRLVFWDETKTRVAYISSISNLVPNKWNEIEFPLFIDNLYNNKFILEFGHYGEISPNPPLTDPYGYFWIEDPQLTLEAVEWEASNNGGKTYVPFLDAINSRYKSINFSSQNYYTSLINKDPYILWDFNTEAGQSNQIKPSDNRNKTYGQFIGTSYVNDQIYSSPGTISSGIVNYPIPTSVATYYNNSAIAVYGGTDSYVITLGSVSLGSVLGIGTGSVTPVTISTRFYTDTTNNKIRLIAAQDQAGTATSSWNVNISGTATLAFECIGVGTVTTTVPSWTGPSSNEKGWHTVAFSYDPEGDFIRLYWDGELVKLGSLPNNISFDSSFCIFGPTATTPHNTWNSFNPVYPFLLVDNVSVHKTILAQKEIYEDYIAATSNYNQLKVRARGYAKNSWISGYEIIPHYAKLGRLKENINKVITQSEEIIVDETTPQENVIIFNEAIFDVSTFGND